MKEFKCLENCGKCCGTFPLDTEFFEKHKDKAIKKPKFKTFENKILFLDQFCIFLNANKKCTIYEARPELCRTYGTIPELPCPIIKPNGNRRSEAQKKHILRELEQKVKKLMRKYGK